MKKSIPNRLFWSWDHSTNWNLHAYGAQNCGVSNAYAKAPEMFLRDYMRVVDFAAEHKINAVGVVGLLREKHGGVEDARRLCAYAREKGVRIYMIAGLFAYGGIFYEGDHPYSLRKFFEKNPRCMAQLEDGSPFIMKYDNKYGYRPDPQGCPSDPQLHDYVVESLDWLFRALPELGGIQIEAGDNGVCQCPRCRARRGAGDGYISAADMAGIYPDAVDAIFRNAPDALVICEAYGHFKDEAYDIFRTETPSEDVKKLIGMPEKVFWQWACDKRLAEGTWEVGDSMIKPFQKFSHVMRAHSGSQWRGGPRAGFAVEKIRQQCLLSCESGLNGVSIFGEYAPFHTNAEFNYLALEYFADDPHASREDYLRDVMAPRLGGEDKAAFYYDAAYAISTPEKIPTIATDIAKITSGITDYETLRRWQYLASYLNGFCWEANQPHGTGKGW